ncbi:hypothetical protein HDZ31DRAFT_80762 [Schizophyllum fasciatum]
MANIAGSEIAHDLELDPTRDSKITRVCLYPGRAEVTRAYALALRAGDNNVVLNGLPGAMDWQSLRVEGLGNATIRDVTIADVPSPPGKPSTSTRLDELHAAKAVVDKDIVRCKTAQSFVESYLKTLNVQIINIADLGSMIQHYEKIAGESDSKLLGLEKKAKQLDDEIAEEQRLLEGSEHDDIPRCYTRALVASDVRVTVRLSVEEDTEDANIVLTYGVYGASWEANYDIRVDSQNPEKPVTLTYKAEIQQSTGEDWTNVPLILHTAAPAHGVTLPKLDTWHVQIEPAAANTRKCSPGRLFGDAPDHSYSATPSAFASYPPPSMRRGVSADSMPLAAAAAPMAHRDVPVTSQSIINTTFDVPGLISVPSDKQTHNVTITKLQLDAKLQWVTVPKKDSRVYLKAHIRNDSEYPLIPGQSSVYLDGSFASRPDIPAINPQERFDCPLGVDPSIHVTYKPQRKKVSKSAFYAFNKSAGTEYTQEIDVFNAKRMGVDLKVVDQIPVSQDSRISIKLINPALPVRTATAAQQEKPAPSPSIKVSESVRAQWDGADDPQGDAEGLGKDGKLNWVCDVQPQSHVHLTLQWEISYPGEERIAGL